MKNNKRIGAIDLQSSVIALIQNYGQQVNDVVYESMKDVADQAVAELKAVSRFSPKGSPTGAYSADWDKQEKSTSRLARTMVVYNEDHYRLTHLLENGHALRRGGRTIGSVKAYEHIRPVEQRVIKAFETDVINKITDINSGWSW